MAAIPFPTDATASQGTGIATGTAPTDSTSAPAPASGPGPSPSSDTTPPSLSQANTPTAPPPPPLHSSHTAIGAISISSTAPHSANPNVNAPGHIPMPPPPLSIGYGGGMGHETHGPPSPSTLTDVILGLHATLYASKKSGEEVMQMVSRFYDNDAVFESPLLQARGREQIANQFKMAFALPGMDVQSELRDVICSDFEFDGTRAGIIDHTLTITLFPTLFGSTATYPEPGNANATGFAGRSGMYGAGGGGAGGRSGMSGLGGGDGTTTAGGRSSLTGGIPISAGGVSGGGGGGSSYFHGRQSGLASAGLSSFTVPGGGGGSYFHHVHPFTPMSAVQTPYPGPGHMMNNNANASTFSRMGKEDEDDARSGSGSRMRSESFRTRQSQYGAGTGTGTGPPYEDEDIDPERDGETGRQFSYMGTSSSTTGGAARSYSGHAGSIAGEDDDDALNGDLSFSTSAGGRGGALTTQHVGQSTRPAMPEEALMAHWSASGFGRASVRAFLWSVFHPRAALKALCSFQIRVMTRLEFNDNGSIVRHEDMWSVREAIEGMVPFAGLVYALERRIVGFLVSWAVASGFTISQILLSHAMKNGEGGGAAGAAARKQELVQGAGTRAIWSGMGGDAAANEVERALLQHQQRLDRERERERGGPISATHSRQPTYSSAADYPYATFSRSRAPSPTRRFGSMSGAGSSTNLVTGTRSRARSLIGQNPHHHLRAASSQNLLQWGAGAGAGAGAGVGSGYPSSATVTSHGGGGWGQHG